MAKTSNSLPAPHAETGAALKRMMRAKGYTVAKLARLANVSVRHLNAALKGDNISLTVLKKITGALGVTDLTVGELTLHGRLDPVNAADLRAHLDTAIDTTSQALTAMKELASVLSGARPPRPSRQPKSGATELIKQVTTHAKKRRNATSATAAANALSKVTDSE